MGGAAGVKDIGTMLGEEKSAKLMPLLLLSDFGCCESKKVKATQYKQVKVVSTALIRQDINQF